MEKRSVTQKTVKMESFGAPPCRPKDEKGIDEDFLFPGNFSLSLHIFPIKDQSDILIGFHETKPRSIDGLDPSKGRMGVKNQFWNMFARCLKAFLELETMQTRSDVPQKLKNGKQGLSRIYMHEFCPKLNFRKDVHPF